MWRLKQFMPKDQGGLEGKTVDVGALKLQLRSTIAQGGFSCVYLARDAASGRQYAVKHIICNDAESVDLVKSEVAVMKALRGHPNVVALHAQVVYDMGRTKECFLVMDYCDKMLANVLENRGAGYFEEKQILLIFRDICNAVYAMHCQSPPIAHRDLKAENVLMGGDGLWKLCDFGSASTNHKRFEKPDEMGLEEDIIRKHTTPAYRAPEMWDLFRRELINEKVDIWALGCLLYKIAYLKSAFDGESKLQILNGNYRIPEAPRYSTAITDLIRDMLTASPGARPDVMQVWRRVNEALPSDSRKENPDKPLSVVAGREHSETRAQGHTKGSAAVPSRSPPLPPTQKDAQSRSVQNGTGGSGVGAFWATPYAQEAKQDKMDKMGLDSPRLRSTSPGSRSRREDPSPPEKTAGHFLKKSTVTSLIRKVQGSVHGAGGWSRDDHENNGYEMRHDAEDDNEADGDEVKGYACHSVSPILRAKAGPSNDPASSDKNASLSSSPVSRAKSGPSNDPGFNEFAAQFDNEKAHLSGNNYPLQAELDRVNKELQQALAEKAVVSSKYEKLTVICRSQQQEIEGLKTALNSTNNPTVSFARGQVSPIKVHPVQTQSQQQSPRGWQAFDQPKVKQSGTIWDLQEGLSPGGSTSQRVTASIPLEASTWQAFTGDPMHRQVGPTAAVSDGRRRVAQHTRAASMGGADGWGFGHDTLSASSSAPTAGVSPQVSTAFGNLSSFPVSSSSNPAPIITDNRGPRPAVRQPAGWAGFS